MLQLTLNIDQLARGAVGQQLIKALSNNPRARGTLSLLAGVAGKDPIAALRTVVLGTQGGAGAQPRVLIAVHADLDADHLLATLAQASSVPIETHLGARYVERQGAGESGAQALGVVDDCFVIAPPAVLLEVIERRHDADPPPLASLLDSARGPNRAHDALAIIDDPAALSASRITFLGTLPPMQRVEAYIDADASLVFASHATFNSAADATTAADTVRGALGSAPIPPQLLAMLGGVLQGIRVETADATLSINIEVPAPLASLLIQMLSMAIVARGQ